MMIYVELMWICLFVVLRIKILMVFLTILILTRGRCTYIFRANKLCIEQMQQFLDRMEKREFMNIKEATEKKRLSLQYGKTIPQERKS